MIENITYIFLVILSKFLSLLPRILVLKLGKFLGLIMYIIFPLRKKVAKINLKIAFPAKNQSQINDLIIKTYKHYGLLMFEFIRQYTIRKNKNIYSINDETLNILNSDSGIICMTAHLGNWEMILPIVSTYKPFTVIVRDQKNTGGDKFFKECRLYNNIVLISKKGSKKKMFYNLNAGHMLGLASDQNAHDKGTQTIFFNKYASFPKGAGHFFQITDSKLVIGFCILNKNFKYDFQLKEIILNKKYEQKEDLIVEVNRLYAQILEKEIKKYPEQYFWFHKKWEKSIYK